MKKIKGLLIVIISSVIVAFFLMNSSNSYANDNEYFIGLGNGNIDYESETNTISFNNGGFNKYNYPTANNLNPTNNYYFNSNQCLNSAPLITVLTHGLNGNARHWSNDYSLSNSENYNFSYDNSSLMERLRKKFDSDVYYAKMKRVSNSYEFKLYKLIDLAGKSDKVYYWDSSLESNDPMNYPNVELVTSITDISKHMVIVFEATDPNDVNDVIYEQLNTMIDKIVYDVKILNGNLLPKINLIGHSRGGITNLQYALDHPQLVSNMFSLGTPYLGSNIGNNSKALEIVGMAKANKNQENGIVVEKGIDDILNEEKYNGYKDRWNRYYTNLYSSINAHAIGGYSDVDFLLSMIGVSPYTENRMVLFVVFNILYREYSFRLTTEALSLIFSMDFAATDGYSGIINILSNEICPDNLWDVLCHNIVIRDDLLVHLSSALAEGYSGFNRYSKRFRLSNSDFNKVSQDDFGVVHNLEARDTELINYILKNISGKGYENKFYNYTELDDGTIKLDGFVYLNTNVSNFSVPETIDGKIVSEIGESVYNAVFNDPNLEETIMDNQSLTINIPSSIKRIDAYAFANNNLITDIVLGSGIESIGYKAFSNCINIDNITLPNSLRTIEGQAFEKTSITNILIPSNVNMIDTSAFDDCPSLSNINVASNNVSYSSSTGVLLSADGSKLLKYPLGKSWSSYYVPESVRIIGKNAFYKNDKIKKIQLSNVTEIEDRAFEECIDLKDIIGLHIEKIGRKAFYKTEFTNHNYAHLNGCLIKYNGDDENINLPYGTKSIGPDAFDSIIALSLYIPSSVVRIDDYAFANSFIKDVKIAGAPSINEYAFDKTSYDYTIYVKSENYDIISNNSSCDIEYNIDNILNEEDYSESIPVCIMLADPDSCETEIKNMYMNQLLSYQFEEFTSSYYTLLGIYLDDEFEIIAYTMQDIYDNDFICYLRWEEKVFIAKFIYGDGQNNKIYRVYATDNIIEFPSLDKVYYRDNKWLYNNVLYNPNEKYEIFEDSTFYAQWNLINYCINYLNTMGAYNPNPSSYTYETNTFSLYNLSKDKYTFVGWYLDSGFVEKIDEISKGTHKNLVLYARWRVENTYSREGSYRITDSGRFSQSYDSISLYDLFGISKETLENQNFSRIVLTITFKMREINDGYQYVFVYPEYSSSAMMIWGSPAIDTSGSETTQQFYVIFDLEDINDKICILYGASGTGKDDWLNYNLEVNVSITQLSYSE